MQGELARSLLGTDPQLIRAAEPHEARVRELLDHLLPVSSRFNGMKFDIKTAAANQPYSIERILCPVLTVSAEDDLFGTAARARLIAAVAPKGRAVIINSWSRPRWSLFRGVDRNHDIPRRELWPETTRRFVPRLMVTSPGRCSGRPCETVWR